ncbi:Hypothetical predicted protein [Paramuricea clavata]|uniref:Uncharacterized protein n=1 Tax=Paramuricea clavata TaxID=317549 RepID=A0A7D9IYT6_PARCT|nr:Hypothetical predicted protein [Paramuricea clavata]
MVSILMNKLPHDLRLFVTRKLKGDAWDIDTLLTILQGEVQARERASAHKPTDHNTPTFPTAGKHSTQSALFSGNSPNCTYCRQAHSSAICTVVTSVDARKELLRKSGRCYVHCVCEKITSVEIVRQLKYATSAVRGTIPVFAIPNSRKVHNFHQHLTIPNDHKRGKFYPVPYRRITRTISHAA